MNLNRPGGQDQATELTQARQVLRELNLEPGKRLREQRRALRLSQEALAHKLGVTSTTVARWERGESPVPPMALKAMESLQWDDEPIFASSMATLNEAADFLEDVVQKYGSTIESPLQAIREHWQSTGQRSSIHSLVEVFNAAHYAIDGWPIDPFTRKPKDPTVKRTLADTVRWLRNAAALQAEVLADSQKDSGTAAVQSDELPEGAKGEVNVVIDTNGELSSLLDLIGAAPGAYPTPAEADAFVRTGRDSWHS